MEDGKATFIVYRAMIFHCDPSDHCHTLRETERSAGGDGQVVVIIIFKHDELRLFSRNQSTMAISFPLIRK